MERQNLTMSIPKRLLKKAKILAATLDKSLSELLRETPEQRVRETDGYSKTKNRQLKLLKTGYNLGTKGKVKLKRDELYDKR